MTSDIGHRDERNPFSYKDLRNQRSQHVAPFGEDDDMKHDGDHKEGHSTTSDAVLENLSFMFEGCQPSKLERFEWVLSSAAAAAAARDTPPAANATKVGIADTNDSSFEDAAVSFASALSPIKISEPPPSTSTTCNNPNTKRIRVVLHVADGIPGAVQSGHYLWDAAISLAEYIVHEKMQWKCQFVPVVVELGAGCALASLTALQVWQETLQCILVTDHDPGTLARARDNYKLTLEEENITSEKTIHGKDIKTAVRSFASVPLFFEPLEWEKSKQQGDACLKILQEHMKNANSREGGGDPNCSEAATVVILGSDLIYAANVVRPLFETASRFVGKFGNCRFLLSQSFLYDETTEAEIDQVCKELAWQRQILRDDGKGNRIQEFRFCFSCQQVDRESQ